MQPNPLSRHKMMPERKYSVSEIDQMRKAVKAIYGSGIGNCTQAECCQMIEEHLRTYMLNGTDPEELEREAAEFMRERGAANKRSYDIGKQGFSSAP
jgi:hypothetical protein